MKTQKRHSVAQFCDKANKDNLGAEHGVCVCVCETHTQRKEERERASERESESAAPMDR